MIEEVKHRAILATVRENSQYVTRGYMMSCIDQYGRELELDLTDEEVIDLSCLLYEIWLKCEANISICSMSDALLDMIKEGQNIRLMNTRELCEEITQRVNW